jgi:hypothetical protein
MLIAFQVPLAEARTFVNADTHRLKTPTWPIPEAYKEFVRGFGGIAKRYKGGLDEWRGEGVYSGAARAVRFQTEPGLLPAPSRRLLGPFSCAFRRFLFDGKCVSRFEVGFTERRQLRRRLRLDGQQCLRLIKDCLSIPVSIPAGKGKFQTAELSACGGPLAAHYLRSSTERKLPPAATEPWWVRPGEPLLFIEYFHDELASLPPYARPVEGAQWDGIALHYGHVPHRAKMLGAWFLGREREVSGEVLDTIRRLRIHLARLHSERDCLKQILRLVSQGKLQVQIGTAACDELQQYLMESVRLLSRQTRFGLPQPALLAAAQDLDSVVTEGERTALLEYLAKVRKNVFKIVEDYTRAGVTDSRPAGGVELFYSYAHEDEALREELEKHLKILQRAGLIQTWHDRGILPGANWEKEIDSHLNSAQVILLLISADFMNSDYCFGIEMARALERQQAGQAVVIPVILRECLWQIGPLAAAKLQALPKDAVPVTKWPDRDTAFTNVAEGIRLRIESLHSAAAGG